ncbi:hypothetical protein RRG08_029647 [Elysia crispata]|uniref:Uncharacterized protein n=1 Tax=Elysia crispata TaxID=231223 RepID=A0AAE0XQJ2_9GAST|nr:hypothetical protein RRG08_029647 [Elysia crispata]
MASKLNILMSKITSTKHDLKFTRLAQRLYYQIQCLPIKAYSLWKKSLARLRPTTLCASAHSVRASTLAWRGTYGTYLEANEAFSCNRKASRPSRQPTGKSLKTVAD